MAIHDKIPLLQGSCVVDRLEISVTFDKEAFNNFQEKAELNERQVRCFAGWLANLLGYGGLKRVTSCLGLGVNTVRTGQAEALGLTSLAEVGRVRRKGGGRKALAEVQPDIRQALQEIIENNSYGNPERVILWTTMSLRGLADALAERGFKISYVTVGKLLEELGYSKQCNQKMEQVGEPHPDRDAQFKTIQECIADALNKGDPVISIDCKKKENLGNFKNPGQEYRRKQDPRRTLDHDFPLAELGKVVPYGVYVLNDNTGFVNLGNSADTGEFAVASIWRWWEIVGKSTFPNSKRLVITCDGGGSNGCRNRLWKIKLAELAEKMNLEIEVHHFPPGTSKWNKIEHRLFCYISKNWAGKPLVDIETTVQLISSTTTRKGLTVKCVADPTTYERGIKVSDDELDSVDLQPLGEFKLWNYKIIGFK